MKSMGLMLLAAGGLLILAGLACLLGSRWGWLGHLPGDIHLRGKNWSFSFPIVTCLALSLLLTLLLNLFARMFRP